MKTKEQTQAARKAAMTRLSHDINKRYDPRQHRRAVRVVQSWMNAQPLPTGDVLRKVVLASYHFSHREFARVMRRAAARK